MASPLRDPRLQPTPDYGTMGPSPDFAGSDSALPQAGSGPSSAGTSVPHRAARNLRGLQLLAMVAGIVAALVASGGARRAGWGKISGGLAAPKNSGASPTKFPDRELDGQKPQRQAEILLTRAVSHTGGTPVRGTLDDGTPAEDQNEASIEEQIQARTESWRGQLKWNSQLSQLTTAALNSSDRSVQASAIEVQLAAYGLAKNQASVDDLVRQASSSDHAQKIWALWALGLLGNRGVETDVVVQVLTAHLKSSQAGDDEDARRWAVEGLALVGTTPTIVPLLEAMHDDPSALVRERAACSLAESGMLSHEQRMAAVPQLIHYSDDPALDAQTHGWAFQALGDITKQRLPNDSVAWRAWYQNAVVGGQ